MATTTLSRPLSSTTNTTSTSALRMPADLSHLTDENFVRHLRRYENESIFVRGIVSSVTIVPNHQSKTGYGFVVVRVLCTGRPYTLIDWTRNEFYHHLCALTKGQQIGWIITPIDWDQSNQYSFMRDHEGRLYSQFYRGSKIVDLDDYFDKIEGIKQQVLVLERKFKSHSRLLNGRTPALPKGYLQARAIEHCLEAATHRFKHVTNEPVPFFPESID
jgi:hypothetical protein